MNAFLNRYATPLTTGLFVVSAVSGTALFFHWQSGAFREMHEWLSMLLLVPFGLHVWKNWRSLIGYAKRGVLVLPLLACLAVAVPFAWPALTGNAGGGGNPAFRAIPLLTQARLSDLAPVLKTTPDALQAELERRGYVVGSLDDTLASVARASGKPAPEVLFSVMPGR